MVTSLTAAAPRAPATHCPDFIISAKSPLPFVPIPHTTSAPKVPNLSVSLKSRLFGTTVMLRPAPSKNDLLSKVCIAIDAICVNPPVELLLANYILAGVTDQYY